MEAFSCGDSAMIGHSPCSFMICIIFAPGRFVSHQRKPPHWHKFRAATDHDLAVFDNLTDIWFNRLLKWGHLQYSFSWTLQASLWPRFDPKADPFFSLSFSAALFFAIHVFIVRYCSDPCIKWSSKARMLWTFINFFQPIPVCRIFIWIHYGGWKVTETPICINTTHLNFSSECLSLKVAKYCSVGRLLLQYACDYRKFKLALWRFTFF